MCRVSAVLRRVSLGNIKNGIDVHSALFRHRLLGYICIVELEMPNVDTLVGKLNASVANYTIDFFISISRNIYIELKFYDIWWKKPTDVIKLRLNIFNRLFSSCGWGRGDRRVRGGC